MNTHRTHTIYTIPHTASVRISTGVMNRVHHTRLIRARIRFAIHGTITLGASLTLVPTIHYAITEASQSGFTEYLSLALSDSSTVFNNLKIFSLSIIESAPMIGSIACLTILAIIIYSGQKGFTYAAQSRREALYA